MVGHVTGSLRRRWKIVFYVFKVRCQAALIADHGTFPDRRKVEFIEVRREVGFSEVGDQGGKGLRKPGA
jgi:hypothetical protein